MLFFPEHPPIPGYEPLRVLGRNGAIVYLARSDRLDPSVVLQVWEGAFPAEAVVLVGLAHPNIIRVFDVGELEKHWYCALEYVETETLAHRLQRGPLAAIEATRNTIAITSALQFMREAGVLAADLTPGNVVMTEPVKVFCHPHGQRIRRPDFDAPEDLSAESATATASSDVYRVGALLYAMLTTHPPVPSSVATRRLRQGDPAEHRPVPARQVNPAVSSDLEAVCLKCLQHLPVDRYRSLPEFAKALTRLQ